MNELISVIVAVYNRADALAAVLRSLARQTDRNFEIVIADDGSGTEVRDVIAARTPRLGVPIRHVWHEDRGYLLPEMRNKALRASAGRYIIWLDGDCIARPDFVAAHRALAALTQLLRGAARARAVLFAYGALLVLWGWRLFMPRTDVHAIADQLTLEHLVPLASLAERVDAFSALHVLQQFLLYLPLGSLLAVWPLRLRGRWAHLWPGVWLAVVIELGHVAIVERYFDATNALVACAGLGIGWIVVRRSGFAPYGEALAAFVAR